LIRDRIYRDFLACDRAGIVPASRPLCCSLLAAGTTNTIEFANPSAYAPDLDRIIVADSPQ
jgi:hypothetical protein